MSLQRLEQRLTVLARPESHPSRNRALYASLMTVLHMQHKVNSTQAENYLELGLRWQDALADEAAELHEHLHHPNVLKDGEAWKWWRHPSRPLYQQWLTEDLEHFANLKQMQMEFIDMLHFAASVALQALYVSSDNFANTLPTSCTNAFAIGYAQDQEELEGLALIKGQSVGSLLSLMQQINRYTGELEQSYSQLSTWPTPALLARTETTVQATGATNQLLHKVAKLYGLIGYGLKLTGASLDEVFQTYLMKNTLNLFRYQGGGYQDGSYDKIWSDGREDNEHMVEIAESITGAGLALTAELLMEELSSRYKRQKRASA